MWASCRRPSLRLQAALGLSLLQAGFLLSLVQVAGMSAGVAFGALADALGFKRSMLLGLGAAGAGQCRRRRGAERARRCCCCARVEGFGFLLVVLPAPGLIRRLVAPQQLEPHARPVGHLHALRRGAGAADRAGMDRCLRLARLVVGCWAALSAGDGAVAGAGRAGHGPASAAPGARSHCPGPSGCARRWRRPAPGWWR